MEILDFTLPKFLLCEKPIKTGDFGDNRLFVYSTQHLSLIECIPLNDFPKIRWEEGKLKKEFQYVNIDGITENWMLIYHQNNVAVVSDDDPVEVLGNAFKFLADYMAWEDQNIDENKKGFYN